MYKNTQHTNKGSGRVVPFLRYTVFSASWYKTDLDCKVTKSRIQLKFSQTSAMCCSEVGAGMREPGRKQTWKKEKVNSRLSDDRLPVPVCQMHLISPFAMTDDRRSVEATPPSESKSRIKQRLKPNQTRSISLKTSIRLFPQ